MHALQTRYIHKYSRYQPRVATMLRTRNVSTNTNLQTRFPMIQVLQLARRLKEGAACQQMMTSPAAVAALCLAMTAILTHLCGK